MDEERLDKALEAAADDATPEDPPPPDDRTPPDDPPPPDDRTPPDGRPDPPAAEATTESAEASERDKGRPAGGPAPGERDAEPATPYRARLLAAHGTGWGVAGRRSRALTTTGHTIGARRPRPGERGRPHLLATITAAAPHQRVRGRDGTALRVGPADVRLPVREGREGNLVLLAVDASGSMAARARLRQVKTAVLSLLVDAYQRRDKIALVTFRGAGATVVLPPTSSVGVAVLRLRDLRAGGRTPLAEGLLAAAQILRVEAVKDPARRPLLVVVTDGRATAGPDALARSQQAAAHLARGAAPGRGLTSVVIDCEPRGTGAVRLGLARGLAATLGADYLDLGEVAATSLTATVRARTDSHRVA